MLKFKRYSKTMVEWVYTPMLSHENVELMEHCRKTRSALTFDDVTLEDGPSTVHPNDVNLSSRITPKIELKGCGIMSAAMDTVTEQDMALALAKLGGIGIIHRNMPPDDQANMVRWVRNKINDGGMISNPVTFREDQTLSELERDIKVNRWTFNNIPILSKEGKLVGIVTRNEKTFVVGENPTMGEMMIPLSKIIHVRQGVKLEQVFAMMRENKVKKLPVIDEDGKFVGLYTWKDVVQDENKKNSFSLDDEGHFLVGAAVGIGRDDRFRIDKLVAAGCRLIVIDTSHGACPPVVETLKYIKQKYGHQTEVMVGNIASYRSAHYLLTQEYVPDALKVGIGSGSICTTRRVTGHGMPQMTAIYEVHRAIHDLGLDTPIIADGGLSDPSDIVKAMAVGAAGFMFGNGFAGTDESPGHTMTDNGKKYKMIRGMGSRAAMDSQSGSRDRYLVSNSGVKGDMLTSTQMKKTVPEGVEGLTEHKGSCEDVMTRLLGGVRAGLGHSGAKNIDMFRVNAVMWLQTVGGLAEGNVHSLEKVLG